jgi:Holliday junction resolvasome RuvABC DNA-binding subunit
MSVGAMLIIIVVCIAAGIISSEPTQEKSVFEPFEPFIQPKTIVKTVIKYVDRPQIMIKEIVVQPKRKVVATLTLDHIAFNEAKSGLMSMGYKAGEAKRVLEAVGYCNTAEEYMKKALTRKI